MDEFSFCKEMNFILLEYAQIWLHKYTRQSEEAELLLMRRNRHSRFSYRWAHPPVTRNENSKQKTLNTKHRLPLLPRHTHHKQQPLHDAHWRLSPRSPRRNPRAEPCPWRGRGAAPDRLPRGATWPVTLTPSTTNNSYKTELFYSIRKAPHGPRRIHNVVWRAYHLRARRTRERTLLTLETPPGSRYQTHASQHRQTTGKAEESLSRKHTDTPRALEIAHYKCHSRTSLKGLQSPPCARERSRVPACQCWSSFICCWRAAPARRRVWVRLEQITPSLPCG